MAPESGDVVRVLLVEGGSGKAVAADALEGEDERFVVETVTGAEDALARLERTRCDCVVVGDELPGTDAVEFLETVRAEYPPVPFLLLTERGADGVAGDAIAAGATDYFPTGPGPCRDALLANRISNAVAQSRAERRLAEERTFVGQALDSLTDLFFVVGTDGRLRRWNDQVPAVTGYSDGQIGGTGAGEFFAADERERVDDAVDTAVATGEATVEADLLTASGDRLPYEFTASRLTDAGGNCLGVVATGRDVSDRRERERDLELAETVFQQTQDAVFVVDVVDEEQFRVQRVNAAYEDLTGLGTEGIRGHTPSDIVGEEVGAEIEARYHECVERRAPMEYEERLPIDGETRQWYTRLVPVVEDGTVVTLVGATRDVTEREERERRLLELRRGIETITANVPMVLFAYDADGVFTRSEGRALEAIGLEPGEAVGESVFELFAGHERVLDHVRRSLAGESVHEVVEVGDVTFESWYQPQFDDDGEVERVVGFSLDVTERKERERALALRNRAIERAPVGVVITDPSQADNPIVYANDRFLEITGYPASAVVGRNCRFLQGENTDPEPVAELRRAIDAAEPVSVELRNYRQSGTEFWNQVTVAPVENDAGEVTHYIGFQRDVTERKEFEQSLSALHEASSEFVGAATRAEAATDVVTATRDVTSLSSAAVYLYDDEAGVLRPSAGSRGDERVGRDLPVVEPGDGPLWRVFASGEPVRHDDVRDADEVSSPATIGSELVLPLGDHGVLVAGDSRSDAFDAHTRELAEIVGVSAEAAFDSIARTERLRDRTRKLDRQTRRLDRVNQLNEAIRRINRALADADTREVILQAVCDRITELDSIDFAWIGEQTGDVEGVSPEVWSGDDRSYLDLLDLAAGDGTGPDDPTADGSGTDEPAVRTARTGDLVHVPNVAGEVRSGTWQTPALRHGYKSVLAVPLSYDESLYGVLAVYSSTQEIFTQRVREVVAELGELVGLGLNAIDRRNALLGKRVTTVELELAGATGPDRPFLALTGDLDCRMAITRILPRDEEYLVYARCEGVTKRNVTAAVERTPGIDRVRRVRGTDPCDSEPCLFEFSLTGTDVVTRLADRGVRSQTVTIESGRSRIVSALPSTVDPATLVADLRTVYPDVELAASEVGQESTDVSDAFFLTEELTAAQREAVEAAYESGFFEWPRDSNGQEVADVLGISQPAFAQRLRAAQRKVFDAYCHDIRSPDSLSF